MSTNHGKTNKFTFKLCSFNPKTRFHSVLAGAVYRAAKKCGIPSADGPHSALLWAKSQTPLPASPSRPARDCEVRFDTKPLETIYPNLNPDLQTTTGLPRPPLIRTRAWHSLAVEFTALSVTPLIELCSFRSLWKRGAAVCYFITEREVWLIETLLNRAVSSL